MTTKEQQTFFPDRLIRANQRLQRLSHETQWALSKMINWYHRSLPEIPSFLSRSTVRFSFPCHFSCESLWVGEFPDNWHRSALSRDRFIFASGVHFLEFSGGQPIHWRGEKNFADALTMYTCRGWHSLSWRVHEKFGCCLWSCGNCCWHALGKGQLVQDVVLKTFFSALELSYVVSGGDICHCHDQIVHFGSIA